jgi:NitT/TauT family transport system substrate-binding protein
MERVVRVRRAQRLKVALAAGGAVLLSVTACGGGSSDAGVGAPGENGVTTVQVAFNPASQFAPMFVGMKEGIFASHGIQLEIVPQTDVAAIISGVASRQYDFGFATAVHLVNARTNNIPVRAVATPDGQQATEEEPEMGNALVAGPGSGIAGPGDLGGRTLAVIGLSSLNTLAAQELAAREGVDVSTIRLVQMPFGQMPAALAARDVDAAVVQSPFIAEALADGSTVVAKPNVELFADQAVGLFLTNESTVENSEAVVRGFATAMVESQRFAAEHVADAQATLVEQMGVTPAAASAATWCTSCNPALDTEGLTTVQELMTKFAGLDEPVDVEESVWPEALTY